MKRKKSFSWYLDAVRTVNGTDDPKALTKIGEALMDDRVDDIHGALASAILSNKHLPTETFTALARWASSATKVQAARQSDNPETLRKLATEGDPKIRAAVAGNSSTPAEVASKLALTDSDEAVVAAAAQRETDSGLLNSIAERLPEWGDGPLRKAILKNSHASDHAKTLAALITGKQPGVS
jgi:hypothetical protein